MTARRRIRPSRRARVVRAAFAVALALGLAAAPAAASAAGPDDIVVTIPPGDDNTPTPGPTTPPPISGGTAIVNAQLRWGLNEESGGGAYFGGCNFLSAGAAGDTGGSRLWTEADGLYRSRDGAVRIEKPTASGGWAEASWASKCVDAAGRTVGTGQGSATGNQVVIDGGTGTTRDGAVEIRWSGSFSVVFYGGLTYWSVSDPVLALDASGNGRLTGTASGYGSDMDDMTKWERIEPRTIVLADIRAADTAAGGGFSVTPEYRGVRVDTGDGVTQVRTGADWGAFPQGFVDFQKLTGQHAYWYSSGGLADPKKPASPVTISYDAAAPVAVPAPAGGGGAASSGTAPSNPLRMPPTVAPVSAEAVAALPGFAANTPLTTQPQPMGLVPDAVTGLSPLVPPLLGSAAALGVGIIAVLSMMQVLPWQRVAVP
jgi:hypothetical protein